MTHVLVWYENSPLPDAKAQEHAVYPEGIHGALGALFAAQGDMQVRTATLADAQQGLGDEALAWADVLVFYGHKYWREVADERVDAALGKVRRRDIPHIAERRDGRLHPRTGDAPHARPIVQDAVDRGEANARLGGNIVHRGSHRSSVARPLEEFLMYVNQKFSRSAWGPSPQGWRRLLKA